MKHPPFVLVLLLSCVLIAVGAWGLSGCSSFGMSAEQKAQTDAQIEATRTSLNAQIADLQAKIATATTAGDAKAVKANTQALELVMKIRAGLDTGQTVFNASIGPDGSVQIGPATAAIGPLVGGKTGELITSVGLIAAVLLNIFQGMQESKTVSKLAAVRDEADINATEAETKDRALKSVIAGINDLREASPTVVAEMVKHKATLKAAFSSEAKETIADMKKSA